ncbi:uncharacterized protein LOC117112601 [Anneissia japonica]|uniref:uncharacterized protein LOC117112601 n=1 Tax=Anneissia japonica TaxID=1529436 RepID=UPI0014257DBA|nr:uncharacterized protein LOC117112601 [Anneissia japonica]
MLFLLEKYCLVLLLGTWGLVCGGHHRQKSNDLQDAMHNHGGIPMGIKDINCDDGIHNLTVDWDGSEDAYTCETDRWLPIPKKPYREFHPVCEPIKRPWHRCMTTALQYDEVIPTSGEHRPIWAKFGEYRYLPVQRWLHNLEHGCVVFLYHPCAPQRDIEKLRQIATRCLRKHIITPYNLLPRQLPFALVTYGCKLQLPYVDERAVVRFVREHALKAPESQVTENGGFSAELITPALIASDIVDSELCRRDPLMLPEL